METKAKYSICWFCVRWKSINLIKCLASTSTVSAMLILSCIDFSFDIHIHRVFSNFLSTNFFTPPHHTRYVLHIETATIHVHIFIKISRQIVHIFWIGTCCTLDACTRMLVWFINFENKIWKKNVEGTKKSCEPEHEKWKCQTSQWYENAKNWK